jgi:hypothetical protein
LWDFRSGDGIVLLIMGFQQDFDIFHAVHKTRHFTIDCTRSWYHNSTEQYARTPLLHVKVSGAFLTSTQLMIHLGQLAIRLRE